MPATDPIEEGEFFPYVNRQRLAEERRRFPRQKAQIPAYSSFNGTSNALLDLNAILDITEKGIAIQASPPLEVKRPVNLRLDLSETGTNVHVTGLVVWSDRTGRAGISLPDLPEQSSRQIREWLFLNLLHAIQFPPRFANGMNCLLRIVWLQSVARMPTLMKCILALFDA